MIRSYANKKGQSGSANFLISGINKIDHSDIQPYLSSRRESVAHRHISPSIENEIPQLQETDQSSENYLQELLKQSKLKDEALQKASYMIKLLEQSNRDLESQVDQLQTILEDKDREIYILNEELKHIKLKGSHSFITDLMNEKEDRNRQNSQERLIATSGFFSFTQPREEKSVRKSSTKIISHSNPAFNEIGPELSISKKLTPYMSKLMGNGIEDTQSINFLETITLIMAKEGKQGCTELIEAINQIVIVEQQAQQQLKYELQNRQNEIIHEDLEYRSDNRISKRLFTLQSQDSSQSNSIATLIDQYQRCIQSYKEYAAYLKAYLCQTINYLAQSSAVLQSEVEIGWIGTLRMLIKDIKSRYSSQVQHIQSENSQLKVIVEQLIKNITLARKQEVKEWNIDLAMKQCQ